MEKTQVLFVCRGDIYRSAVAERLLVRFVRDAQMMDRIEVRSRGLQGYGGTLPPKYPNLSFYPTEWNAAKDTLEELEILLDDHTATALSSEDVETSDVIIAMSEDVLAELLEAFPGSRQKIRLFGEPGDNVRGVSDPHGRGGCDEHRTTILRIRSGVAAIFRDLVAGLGENEGRTR